jgi:cytoskeletal protein CcmA (bactofilin family)
LGPRDRLVGQLYVEGDVRVVGTVEGGLEVTGSVEIDGGGRVTGPVTARDRLVVGRAGSMKGDVRVARLVVADGATFIGNVSMGKSAFDAPPKVAEPLKVPEVVQPVEAVMPTELVMPAEPRKAPEPAKATQPLKAAQPAKAVQPAKPVQPSKIAQTINKALNKKNKGR